MSASTDSANSPTPQHRRRWYQFSLRTLLVAMVVLGVGFAWVGLEVKRASDQREAVQAIRSVGGKVEFGEPRSFFARQEWSYPVWAAIENVA